MHNCLSLGNHNPYLTKQLAIQATCDTLFDLTKTIFVEYMVCGTQSVLESVIVIHFKSKILFFLFVLRNLDQT